MSEKNKNLDKDEKTKIEERLDKIEETLNRRIEEIIEEAIDRRLKKGLNMEVEELVRSAPNGSTTRVVFGPRRRLLVMKKTPIPIRNLNLELYRRMRKLAYSRGLTVGEIFNEAMRYYLENYDELRLMNRKKRVLERLERIGTPGFLTDAEVRDTVKKELMRELEKINKRLDQLKKGKERG